MNIEIRNANDNSTYVTEQTLKADARALVKPYGRLYAISLIVHEHSGRTQLVASYISKDGNPGSVTQVI